MHFTIVSYTFPPSTAIGGRRWAKFSQQLASKGIDVTVICSKESVDKDWFVNEFPNINCISLPKYYPFWLTGQGNSLLQRSLYWIATKLVSRLTKKNLYDRGLFWRRPLLKTLTRLHNDKSIDVLIATGAPFSLLSIGAEFKRKNDDIFYVIDLRDPWTWGSYYGIPNLSKVQKRYQEIQEGESVKHSDMVCYPVQNMGDVLTRKYEDFKAKFYLLPHAFEPHKFLNTDLHNDKRSGYIYGGTLYDGIEEYISKLEKIINKYTDLDFVWDIYTGSNFPLINEGFGNGRIRKHSFISESELFSKISQASAYLVFYPIQDKDLVSTKFFEIIYTKTPIIYIGEAGEVGDFIVKNKVGVHILPENMEQKLPQYLAGEVPHEPGFFDIQKYTFSSVTDNLLDKLKAMMSA